MLLYPQILYHYHTLRNMPINRYYNDLVSIHLCKKSTYIRSFEEWTLLQPIRQGYLWIQNTVHLFAQWFTALLEGKVQKNNIAALDGVRAIACLSVVAFHISLVTRQDIHIWNPDYVNPLISAIALSGDTGVTLFFILSGFLLFLPYAKTLLFEHAQWPSIRRFYLRRVLRIIPAYYITLFLMVLLYRPEYRHLDHLRNWGFFLTLFMDSSQSTYKSINGPFWTLAVEWQFYLLLPILAIGMGLLVRRGSLARRLRTLLLCLGGLIVWGIGTRYAGLYLNAHPSATFLLPRPVLNYILPFIYGASGNGTHGKFLEDFAIGMLLSTAYILARNLPAGNILQTRLRQFAPWLLAGALLWLLLMVMWKYNQANLQSPLHPWPFFDHLASIYDSVGEFGFAIGYGLFVAATLFGAAWLKRPFEWAPLRWIGFISFGIYMWHLLLLESFTELVMVHLHNLSHLLQYSLYWGWLLVFIIPCALALYLLVEKPFMNLGHKPQRPTHEETSSESTLTEKRVALARHD